LNIMTVIGIDEALQNHSGVYDGRDAWELALRTLIARERNRRQSGTSALSDQLERYSMRQVPCAWSGLLTRVTSTPATR
jgi:hypothetical protein